MSFGKKIRKHTFARQMGLGLGTWQWCQVIPRTFAQQMGFIWNKKLKQTSKRLGLNMILKKKMKRSREQTGGDNLGLQWELGLVVNA